MSFSWLSAQKDTLIYVGDPLCSWCYGFAPELEVLMEQNPTMEFKLVLGGLRPFGTEKIVEMKDFLTHHWEQVHARTNQPFSYDILNLEGFLYDTEPASRAVVTVRHMKPSLELAYFKAVQQAFYQENLDVCSAAVLADLAEQVGVDRISFLTNFNTDKMKHETTNDFRLAAQMGIKGFPSVLLKAKGQVYQLSNGYQKAEVLQGLVQQQLK